MEKIQTIEQLDKVGLKICEMLNASIDKASIILPETLQQFIYFTIASDALEMVLVSLGVFVIWFLRSKLLNNKLGIDIVDGEARDIVTSVTFIIASIISLFFVICWVINAFEILEAILAPNMLIIEKFSQLMTRQISY